MQVNRAGGRLFALIPRPHIGIMPHFDLTDIEAEALIQELAGIIESARYPFSPRIQTLRAMLNKLRPEAVRAPLAVIE